MWYERALAHIQAHAVTRRKALQLRGLEDHRRSSTKRGARMKAASLGRRNRRESEQSFAPLLGAQIFPSDEVLNYLKSQAPHPCVLCELDKLDDEEWD